MEAATHTPTLSASQIRMLRYALYYGLFNYPLTQEELGVDQNNLHELMALVEEGLLYRNDTFYSLNGNQANIDRRIAGNLLCEKTMERAINRAKFIYQFPFVKGVYLSGSMSKGFLAEDGDVDFFIVTREGRLWLSRTLLILYKKLFLANSRKFFCLNYFIDEKHLEIEEKNIFTATELVTLVPICHDGIHQEFAAANDWIEGHYPTVKSKSVLVGSCPPSWSKRLSELLLSNGIGSLLDRWTMGLTLRVWKRKFGNFEPSDFDLALKSRRYVSKHHPQNFQKKVLTEFQERVTAFEKKHKVELGGI